MCVKFEVSNTNILRVADINVTKKDQIWLPNVQNRSHNLHLQTGPNYNEDQYRDQK